MISEARLNKFFLKDGTPNFEMYCKSYRRAHLDNCVTMEGIDAEKEVLSFVNYEYAKRGFLRRGEGHRIVYEESTITLGFIGKEPLYFANEEDAKNFRELLKIRFGGYIQEVPRR
ncbi:MAG: hypothetical protein KKF67_03495 [Nanoarchaeota archaeon]|nr:hypothetical protein [Nanoarchaeota archaeon]